MHFPYLAGSGTQLTGVDRRDLAQNALPALERLAETNYPRLMAAIERSARWQSPITTKFRLGGETFALLLPLTPEFHCRKQAERLCERIDEGALSETSDGHHVTLAAHALRCLDE